MSAPLATPPASPGRGVLEQDAAHLEDYLGIALRRVARAHDELRRDAVDVRARVAHDAVAARLGRAVALHRDDRVRLDSRRDRDLSEGLEEGIARGHVVDARRQP